MLLTDFFSWWYTAGWKNTLLNTRRLLGDFAANFSIAILLKTLFAPWKQLDARLPANPTLGDRLRHIVDKLISRVVGFMVRTATLLAALIVFSVILAARLVWIVVWPLLPATPLLSALVALGFL